MLETLRSLLEASTSDLEGVTQKRLFGCDGFFTKESIFGLIWKTGRIGLKLPDEESFCELMKLTGAAPWKAGDRTMAHWVLVPESFHGDRRKLDTWVKRAHTQAMTPRLKGKKAKPSSKPKKKIARAPKKGK